MLPFSHSARDAFLDAFLAKVEEEQRIAAMRMRIELAAVLTHAPLPILTRELSLIVRPEPMVVLPEQSQKLLLCAPRLVLDEVTRYLSWEEKTWRQKIIEDTEREMLGVGWRMWEEHGVDYAIGSDITIWSKFSKALQIPPVHHMPRK